MCFQRSKKIEISQSFVAPRKEQGHWQGQGDEEVEVVVGELGGGGVLCLQEHLSRSS